MAVVKGESFMYSSDKVFSGEVGNKSLLLYTIHMLLLKGTKSQMCSGTGRVYFHFYLYFFIFLFFEHWIKITSCWHHPALIYCNAARPGRVSVQPHSDRKASGAGGDKGLAQGHINGSRKKTGEKVAIALIWLFCSQFFLWLVCGLKK